MKTSDQSALKIYEDSDIFKNSFVKKTLDDVGRIIFRIGRKFDRRKIDLIKLFGVPQNFEDKKDVEIIIPIFGESHLLEECLNTIELSFGINAEVIIVDNGVPNKVKELVQKSKIVKTYIENSENKGFGGACNIGMEKSNTEYPILLNSDVELMSDSIRLLLDVMEANPKIGTCSSVLVDEFGRYEEIGRVLTKQATSIAIEGTKRVEGILHKGISLVPYASFACVAVRRSVFSKTDGFDQQFWPAYSEDMDLAIQFIDLGYVSAVALESVVLHKQGSSTKEISDLSDIKERNRSYLLKKHEAFFESVPDVSHDETIQFRLKRGISYPREAVLILTTDNEITIDKISTLLGCDRDSLVLKFISVVVLDSNSQPVDLDISSQTEMRDRSVYFYTRESGSIDKWFRDHIGVFDKVILAGIDINFKSSPAFELLSASQPDVNF